MITIIGYFLTFVIGGAMFGVMLLSCGAVLALGALIWHMSEKAYNKIRTYIRNRRIKREFKEKYKNEKVDIHVL